MNDADELVVLVDESDREIGVAPKLEAHRQGALHRAFSLMIWNGDGELLLQQRHAGKYHSGGLWTNAVCGHPRPGEDVPVAALRRLEEEMGFSCPLQTLGTLRYRAALDRGLTEHELVHVFRGRHDGAVLPDPGEADGYRWVPLDILQAEMAADPARFSAWFREYVAARWPLEQGSGGQSQG
jgi:isopentenyl-diphosphate delta-isomerase